MWRYRSLPWANGRAHLRPSLLGCCHPWVSSSAFSLCSPPPRCGQTTKRLGRRSIARASALRSAAILATSFPTEYQVQLRELVRRYIADVVAQEWPMMARGTANLRAIPGVLAEALQATLALNPSSEGQKTAQRDIATALETALDARR